jgi:hypothetical protein
VTCEMCLVCIAGAGALIMMLVDLGRYSSTRTCKVGSYDGFTIHPNLQGLCRVLLYLVPDALCSPLVLDPTLGQRGQRRRVVACADHPAAEHRHLVTVGLGRERGRVRVRAIDHPAAEHRHLGFGIGKGFIGLGLGSAETLEHLLIDHPADQHRHLVR